MRGLRTSEVLQSPESGPGLTDLLRQLPVVSLQLLADALIRLLQLFQLFGLGLDCSLSVLNVSGQAVKLPGSLRLITLVC